MEQHALPQNITAYRFRLVGDMTLKQFLELAIGLVGAWLVFSSKLNFVFKWTFGPFLGFFGFALAFMPFEDRPLDQWIINFFKAIYGPTQFIYKPLVKTLDVFTPTTTASPSQTSSLPADPQQLEAYLKTLPPDPFSSFDIAENQYLEHIRNLFGALGVPASKKTSIDFAAQKPNFLKTSTKGVRVRKLSHPQMCILPHATVFHTPEEPQTAAMPSPEPQAAKPTVPPKPFPKPAPRPPKIPKAAVVQAPPQPKSSVPVQVSSPLPQPPPPTPPPANPAPQPISQTVFAQNIIMPQQPEKANLVSGITLDKNQKIISSVILEIKDSNSQPVRALKSNKLGQFFIATPLEDGVYQIQAEHPNHSFAIMKLEAKGEIIPPLKIQAK